MTEPNLQIFLTNLTSGDDQIAESAAVSIAALGESALPALFDVLDSKESDARWWALRTLSEIPHPSVPPLLHRLIDDPSSDICQCAILGLSQQPTPDAIPDLVNKLEDEDRLLARLAGDSLIAIGSQAVPSLIETLESGHPGAQIEACRGLAMIEDSNAVPALFNAWQDGSPMIRYWAEEGFERMGIGMQFFRPE